MLTGLKISYQLQSLDGRIFLDALEKLMKFEPYRFTKKNTSWPWQPIKHKKLIEKVDSNTTITLSGSDLEIFSLSNTGGVQTPCQILTVVQDAKVFMPDYTELAFLLNHRGFVSAYLFDEHYKTIQSTKYSGGMLGIEFSENLLSSIKRTPWKSDGFGGIEYDIRYNPGRFELISFTWLMPAWKMWFGLPFFEVVPKEKILSFPNAFKIQELPNGLVYVQLFEKLEESATPENMRLQLQWREWLDFDALRVRYR